MKVKHSLKFSSSVEELMFIGLNTDYLKKKLAIHVESCLNQQS